ncbi:putative ribonuclease H protein [Cardamine amara subsp. amara]|uniref:Ribonuclease H protein n=1 Tax=Cardamine amara subsp. amara TaxID=228776 RepID=A0ABD0ZJH9_CARAN
MEDRKELWSDLRDHNDSPIIRNKPWIMLGDFNETLDMAEHSRVDTSPQITMGMRDFQALVNYCSFSDMAYQGPLYTWCNKRENDLIMKKLDRVMINERWLQTYMQSYTVFEAGGCSDHLRSRINLKLRAGRETKRKPFKFVNVVTELEDFKPMIDTYWKETEPIFMSTSSLFRFSKKLKALKPSIRQLAKSKLGNLEKKAKEAYQDLCYKQELNLMTPSSQSMEDENEAWRRWDRVAALEEKFLKQKSKLHWLKVGDKNNKTFHRAAVTREANNSIREIVCGDGRVVSSEEEIKEEAELFFKNFLQLTPQDYAGISVNELQNLLPFRCSEEDRAKLTKDVSGEEIKKVLFSMPNDKSPGPDGFTSEFYKAAWDIIGDEFIMAIQSFFVKGFLPKGINATILALIPKKTEAREMKDYRPISCCNVIYKVISKIIANRLKMVLPKFIAGNQSAFVQNRLLIENMLLAMELVKDYHKDTVSSRCAIKIDISKAFDSVQWSFLINTLQALNFPLEFIHWITLCITTASFSVQVNGELAGYFRSERGLQQGCSLSPYLFVISMDVLSKMLDKAAGAREFGYHPRCKNIGLTHISFADDIMVLTDGKVRSMEGIAHVFDVFSQRSGLKISMEKSTMYLAGVTNHVQQELMNHFPFAMGQLPVRYLGLPLVTKRLTSADYSPLLEQIRKRIGSWTARYLTFAGRLNLISSVLWSIVNFWLAAFRLPKSCIKEIDRMCSSFLWSGPDMNLNKAKITWEEVCKTKQEGGLGLRSLREANDVSCLKLIWRIVSHGPSLWVKWIKTYLIKHDSFWSLRETTSLGSWMWKKLLKYRQIAKPLCRVAVGNGDLTSFWFDNWSGLGCLMDLVGPRGIIDMGIARHETVAGVSNRRRRRHRFETYNTIEDALSLIMQGRGEDSVDIVQWKGKGDKFKSIFSTKDTWNQIRTISNKVEWHKAVWFTHATPKYSFCSWLAIHNRLSTGDRMLNWNVGSSGMCVLCSNGLETRDHLFFSYTFSAEVWADLAKNVLNARYTTDWPLIVTYVSDSTLDRTQGFIARYVFQASIHTVWRERNARRHGERPNSASFLIRWIDKQVRNQLSSIRALGDTRYREGLQLWFGTRS